MRCFNLIYLSLVLVCSVSLCGEFVSQSARSEPIFPVTGKYVTNSAPVKSEREDQLEELEDQVLSLKKGLIDLNALITKKYETQSIEPPCKDCEEKNKPSVTKQPIPARTTHNYSAYSPWYVGGRNTPDSHLIQVHGADPAELSGMSQDQKNRMHGMYHGERPHSAVQFQRNTTTYSTATACPGGVCPTTGIFGRRRR